ncbi:hypothetical protein SAMN04488692_12830 [Halarsenatibacter silvermanii]|uniref:Phage integrase, N-terminal SAM-like domain n=1 Tax=Halarsenatibacter silvermanii TaxID=321763 RepID=A0A1G9SFU6_9FIRM|nr:hypothetical protein SAMN04488692_12830 [Halarsenatibacter silvermanii]
MTPKKNLVNNDERQSIQEVVDRFIKHCKSKQLSDSTIDSYKKNAVTDLKNFFLMNVNLFLAR